MQAPNLGNPASSFESVCPHYVQTHGGDNYTPSRYLAHDLGPDARGPVLFDLRGSVERRPFLAPLVLHPAFSSARPLTGLALLFLSPFPFPPPFLSPFPPFFQLEPLLCSASPSLKLPLQPFPPPLWSSHPLHPSPQGNLCSSSRASSRWILPRTRSPSVTLRGVRRRTASPPKTCSFGFPPAASPSKHRWSAWLSPRTSLTASSHKAASHAGILTLARPPAAPQSHKNQRRSAWKCSGQQHDSTC
mmetsp:Transcript_49767/g.81822  ORF Transcript_49767/g.81822 Transcript_49767/m.81822 type:complete len:246 (-) Transcript_49767:79-816(-)